MSRGRGRPRSDNRATAVLLGDRTYLGKRCKRCNGTERYVSNGGCVACQLKYVKDARLVMSKISDDDLEALLGGSENQKDFKAAEEPEGGEVADLDGDPVDPAGEPDDLDDLLGVLEIKRHSEISEDTEADRARYFVHYESDCVIKALDDGPLSDPLVEEIDLSHYQKFIEAGFTEHDRT